MGAKKKAKNESIKYFLIVLCITMTLMLVKKSNILETLTNSSSLRNLLDKSKRNYLCDKAGSRLTNKYKDDFKEEDPKVEKLSKSQQSIIDFARDKKYSNIKPFVKHVAIFFVFIILAIFLIFFWISYCCCSSCSCCLFSTSGPSKCCSGIQFFITGGCLFLVIIFSIVNLALITKFYQGINGAGCSIHYFLDHVIDGLAPDYSKRSGEWQGIDGLINKLNYTNEEMRNIKDHTDNLNTKISIDPNKDQCKKDYETLKKQIDDINNMISSSFSVITTNKTKSDMSDIKKDFADANDKVGDELYKVMHDHTNKYAKKISQAIFFIVLFGSCFGLAVLFLYFCCGLTVMRKIYVIFWNLFMLLAILAFLYSGVFGIIGYIFTDGAHVSQYILSQKNLNSSDPLVFKSTDKNVINLIETCANGDGNFSKVIDGYADVNEGQNYWKKNKDEYLKQKGEIDCGNDERTSKLKGYYDRLIVITNRSLDLTYNLTNVTCRFVRNDKNILVNEIDDAGKYSIAMCVMSILIAIFLCISIVSGILLVHKYRLGDQDESGIAVNNNSTTDIHNNATTQPNMFPNNNQMVK